MGSLIPFPDAVVGGAAVAVLAHAAFGSTHGRPGTSLAAVGPIFGPLLLAEGHPPHRAAAFLVCGAAGSMFMIPVLAESVFVWAEVVALPVRGLLLPCGIMAGVFFLGLFLQAFFLSKSTQKPAGRWHLARGIGGGIAMVAAAIGMLTYHVFVLAAVGLLVFESWRAGRGARLRTFGDLVERAGRRVIRFVVAVTVLGMLIDPVLVASTILTGGVPHIEPEGPAAALSALMFEASGSLGLGLTVAVAATLILGAVLMPHPAYILCVSAFGGFFAGFGAPGMSVHAFVFALTVASVFATPFSRHVFAAAALAAASPMRTAANAAVLGSPLVLLAVGMAVNPALVGMAKPGWVLLHCVLAGIGTVLWTGAVHGHLIGFGPVPNRSFGGWALRVLIAMGGVWCFLADVSAEGIPWLAGLVAAAAVLLAIRLMAGFLAAD